jgi:hypothetical protein
MIVADRANTIFHQNEHGYFNNGRRRIQTTAGCRTRCSTMRPT